MRRLDLSDGLRKKQENTFPMERKPDRNVEKSKIKRRLLFKEYAASPQFYLGHLFDSDDEYIPTCFFFSLFRTKATTSSIGSD